MSFRSTAPILPLSPASSPDQGVKHQTKTVNSNKPLAKPHSPASMSVATKRYVPSYTNGGHTNEMANRSPDSFVSQPQRQQQQIHSTSSQMQPVAHQQNMLKRPAPQDEEERPTSKRQKQENVEDHMDVESVTASNHDRQDKFEVNGTSQPAVSFSDDVLAREIPGNSKVDSDPIFKDVGPAFRIGKSSKTSPIPAHNIAVYLMLMLFPSSQSRRCRSQSAYDGQIWSTSSTFTSCTV